MKSRIFWLILSFLVALSLVLASCTTTTEEEEEEEGVVVEEEEEEEGGPPVTGDWWDKFGEPQYGGTLTVHVTSLNPLFDPWDGPGSQIEYWHENVSFYDWTVDRKIWSFAAMWVPDEYNQGCLAESWETPDTQTVVLHIREGVHWQDKAPMNGREMTAYDVEFSYHRIFGLGSGFTEACPFWAKWGALMESVTATDKYTVVIKFKQPSALNLSYIMEPASYNMVTSPEVVELYGDYRDWKNAVGTGPWVLVDYVASSSLTFDKNPNYWGYDERHPENQLPYADICKLLCIPDTATALAALRTGKIDMIANISWEQAASLARTNPELLQAALPNAGTCVDFRCDTVPFTDINVRKALQLALDRETIGQTHYGGSTDGKPAGLINPVYKGYCTPYDEWPQELKDEYSYNPARARELLAEAGYPNGFKTNVIAGANADLDLLQIIKAYFMDVGVDMEIKVMDPVAVGAFCQAGQHDQMVFGGWHAAVWPPWVALDGRWRFPTNYTFNKDPVYEAMILKVETSLDLAELAKLSNEADMYAISQHWAVNVCPTATYTIYQPYLEGYSGENCRSWMTNGYLARFWIDQDLKASMGH